MRRAVFLPAVIAVSGVWIVPSWAGTIGSTVADGELTVTGTADADDITLRFEAGTSR